MCVHVCCYCAVVGVCVRVCVHVWLLCAVVGSSQYVLLNECATSTHKRNTAAAIHFVYLGYRFVLLDVEEKLNVSAPKLMRYLMLAFSTLNVAARLCGVCPRVCTCEHDTACVRAFACIIVVYTLGVSN